MMKLSYKIKLKQYIPRLLILFLFLLFTCTTFYNCSDNPVISVPVVYKYNVLIGSRNNHSVKEYDGATGDYLGNFVDSASGGLNTTQDLLYLSDSILLVTGLGNTAIKKYNGKTGEYLGDFSAGYTLQKPTKMSIGPDNKIYVSQWGQVQNKVVRFNMDGSFVDEFTSTGISNALDHVWDSNKNMYVAGYGSGNNGKIYKFDSLGNSLGIFINTGSIKGPSGLWLDSAANFYVADWTIGKVIKFDSQGQFIADYITGLANVEGFVFDPDNNLLLCDWTLNKVNKYDSLGNFISVFTSSGGLSSPNSAAIRRYKVN
jgi:hypothetical protein